MFSRLQLSKAPGEEKPSVDYLLTVCLVFPTPVGVIWGVAEYTLAQIPGH